jgi:hypothetical protein
LLETDKTIASFCNELGIEPPFEVKWCNRD